MVRSRGKVRMVRSRGKVRMVRSRGSLLERWRACAHLVLGARLVLVLVLVVKSARAGREPRHVRHEESETCHQESRATCALWLLAGCCRGWAAQAPQTARVAGLSLCPSLECQGRRLDSRVHARSRHRCVAQSVLLQVGVEAHTLGALELRTTEGWGRRS